MRVLIAPDKFKGSLTAGEVCAALAAGIAEVAGDATVVTVPMADGGEGTLDAALASGFARHAVTVTSPLGEPVRASIGVRGAEAVVELALASGLALVAAHERNALAASSVGTGECIRAALDRGATRVFLAIGGSASTDGGAGMLHALGARLLDRDGRDLPAGGGALAELARVDLGGLDPRLARTEFVLANDVSHALLGAEGAARVFGPQKGASAADVERLEQGLARLVDALEAALPGSARCAEAEGSGAAGGVGYAALAVLGARQRAGVDVVVDFTRLDRRIAEADLVITGEGSFDAQSLGGKTPVGVARAAHRHGAPVVMVCGRTTLGAAEWARAGFRSCHAIADLAPSPEASMRDARDYLRRIGGDIARTHLLAAAHRT
ncbi:glycerate kinase [Leucobacter chromiiresistens]